MVGRRVRCGRGGDCRCVASGEFIAAFGVAGVELDVGPFVGQGAVKSLYLAVGLRSVRPSSAVLDIAQGDLFPLSRTAGVGCSRRRVGRGVNSFVVDRAAVVQGAVAADGVVEGFDVFEDRRGELGPGGPGSAVEQFDLH